MAKTYYERLRDNDPSLGTTISIQNSTITDEKMIKFAEAMAANTSITDLEFINVVIRPKGAAALARLLIATSTLTRFNLSNNRLGPEGAKLLGRALPHNHSLTYLALGLNQLGDEGCRCICEGLCRNDTLLLLDIASNEITDTGAKAIAQLVRQNRVLSGIQAQNNKITLLKTAAEKRYLDAERRTNAEIFGEEVIAETEDTIEGMTNINPLEEIIFGEKEIVMAMQANTTLLRLELRFAQEDSEPLPRSYLLNHGRILFVKSKECRDKVKTLLTLGMWNSETGEPVSTFAHLPPEIQWMIIERIYPGVSRRDIIQAESAPQARELARAEKDPIYKDYLQTWIKSKKTKTATFLRDTFGEEWTKLLAAKFEQLAERQDSENAETREKALAALSGALLAV